MTTAPAPVNAAEIAYWTEVGRAVWVTRQEQLDRIGAPFGQCARQALSPRPGERIMDVGCGCGSTTMELGQEVGPAGSVLGVDISVPMLDFARRRAEQAGLAHVRFREADAQVSAFDPPRFDGLFSRFGIMFFADPVAAFTNLHQALQPGGRLAFACWRTLPENSWATVPRDAALPHLPPLPTPAAGTPSAFSLADPALIHDILGRAGFADISAAPFDARVDIGPPGEALDLFLQTGPVGSLLREHPDRTDAVAAALRDALARHTTDGVVQLAGAAWIVTATA